MADFTFETDPKYNNYSTRLINRFVHLLALGVAMSVVIYFGNKFEPTSKFKFLTNLLIYLWPILIFILLTSPIKLITKITIKNNVVSINQYSYNALITYEGNLSEFIIEKRYYNNRAGAVYFLNIQLLKEDKTLKQGLQFGWTKKTLDDIISAISASPSLALDCA